MKLFRRIYLQVFIGCLLLSQIPFLYCLYESQRQSLETTKESENENFVYMMSLFNKKIDESEMSLSNGQQRICDLAAVNAFRNVFGSSGALYRDGEELYNMCPYDFDYEVITQIKESQNQSQGMVTEARLQQPQKADGRRLLVFCYIRVSRKGGSYLIVYYKDVTDIYELSRLLFFRGLIFALAMLAVTGLLLYRRIYRAVKPLWELREAAAAIAGGDYRTQVPVRTKDEIGELTVSFNQMAQRVEEHVDKLNQTNEAQRRLIGSLAHELKTPMTAIVGYSDTLLTVRISEQQRLRALEYIRSESRRLSRLSAKMMELSGLYEWEGTIAAKEKAMAELLAQLKDLTVYRREEKGIHLETVCSPAGLKAWIDEDLIMSLLMNLVDNACKASAEGSTVTVSADEQGLYVEDTGKGIPREEIARVTEAFYMVDKSRSRKAGGIGLGLAFCEQIAKLHHARLHIESEEGRGTRVSVLWVQA